jgi:hypothetical protein
MANQIFTLIKNKYIYGKSKKARYLLRTLEDTCKAPASKVEI